MGWGNSDSGNGNNLGQWMSSGNPLAQMANFFLSNSDLGPKLQGIFSRFQDGMGGGGQPSTPTPQAATPPASPYAPLRMPSHTWHTSMPQFEFGQGGGLGGGLSFQQPTYNYNGGALDLPGWALQQAGNAPTASNWRPTLSGQNNGNNSGGTDASSILSQGFGYHPTMGFVSLSPQAMQYADLWGDDYDSPFAVKAGMTPDQRLALLLQQSAAPGSDAFGVSGFPGPGPEGTDGGIF